MSIDEAVGRVKATGRSGFSIWQSGREYMACLLGTSAIGDVQPDYETSLWDYTSIAQEAMEKIVEKAERLAR